MDSHISVRRAVQLCAISPAYCAIRTEREGMEPRSLFSMKHPPAASSAELCATAPRGSKKGLPRIFHTAVPLFSFSGFRKIQKNSRNRLFQPDGTGPVPSSAGFR